MGKRKTHEEFCKEVYDLYGEEYEVLGNYTKTNNKILIKHNVCSREWEVRAYSFLGGSGCPICGIKKRAKSQTKTHNQFCREVYDLVENEYEVLETYINSSTHIKMKHTICNCIYSTTPNNFIKGSRCPQCNKNYVKTTDQFILEVRELVGSEYSILGDYKNNQTKILIKHNNCNNEFKMTPISFLRGQRCPICIGKNILKTTNQYKKEVHDLVGEEFKVLGEYQNNKVKIKMRHETCGYTYKIAPSSFLSGVRCPNCAGNVKKTHEEFINQLYEIYNDEYTVKGEYINNRTKLIVTHNVCGYDWNVVPSDILRGVTCPLCAGVKKLTHQEFVERVNKIALGSFTILNKYINGKTKILVKHNKCGYEWEVMPFNLLYYLEKHYVLLEDNKCPKCTTTSIGETIIKNILSRKNIVYETPIKFNDCKDKNMLSFDFAILDINNKLLFLIEYDGKQHYEPVEWFGGEEKFKIQQEHDLIKTRYCKDNNIPLLRIPYWDFDKIEEILDRELSKYLQYK